MATDWHEEAEKLTDLRKRYAKLVREWPEERRGFFFWLAGKILDMTSKAETIAKREARGQIKRFD